MNCKLWIVNCKQITVHYSARIMNSELWTLIQLHSAKSTIRFVTYFSWEDGVAQSVEHWTANLATRVRSPVGEEPSDLVCAFLQVQMESNWAGLSVCNCRHTGKWCGTIKAVGNTDHTRQTWIHMQTPLSPLAGCGPVGEGTSDKVLNWTVRSLNHAYTTTYFSWKYLGKFNILTTNWKGSAICYNISNIQLL